MLALQSDRLQRIRLIRLTVFGLVCGSYETVRNRLKPFETGKTVEIGSVRQCLHESPERCEVFEFRILKRKKQFNRVPLGGLFELQFATRLL